MDPMNNPTPTPNPVTPGPTPAPEPPVAPVEQTPAPSEPVAEPAPAEPVAPVEPAVSNPEPVNPVINPGVNPEPVNPVFQPGSQGGFAATDPIMQPEAPKAPDPIEEELKAPMEPAGPAPGSIGSAMSGPTSAPAGAPAENPFATSAQGQTPSVSFNDPATQSDNPTAMGAAKPKAKKGTLIALIAVAAIVVVVLIVILVMSLTQKGGNQSSQANSNNNSNTNSNVVEPEEDNTDLTPTPSSGTLSCTRNMTQEELVKINDAASGAINISAEFDDDKMVSISRVDSVVFNDENVSATEPVENEVHEAKAADLNTTSALNYYLSPNADGSFEMTLDEAQANYENLDFTCKVL